MLMTVHTLMQYTIVINAIASCRDGSRLLSNSLVARASYYTLWRFTVDAYMGMKSASHISAVFTLNVLHLRGFITIVSIRLKFVFKHKFCKIPFPISNLPISIRWVLLASEFFYAMPIKVDIRNITQNWYWMYLQISVSHISLLVLVS